MREQVDDQVLDSRARQRRARIVRFCRELDSVPIAGVVARPVEILQSHERFAEQLSGQMQQPRLRVGRQPFDFDACATAEGLQPAVDVVKSGRAGAILRVACSGSRESCDAALDRCLVLDGGQRGPVLLERRELGGRRRRRRGRGAVSWRGHGYLRDRLTVSVDWMERRSLRRLGDEQIVEIQHRPDIGLRAGATERPQPMNTRGDLSGARIGFGGLLRLSIDRGDDVIVAHPDDVAGGEQVTHRLRLGQRPLVVVDEDAVGAQVLEEKLPVAVFHARVMSGDVAQRIGQNPVVIRRTADVSAVHGKSDAAAIPKQASLITDDTQPKRHVSRTGPAVNVRLPLWSARLAFHGQPMWPDASGHIMPPSN